MNPMTPRRTRRTGPEAIIETGFMDYLRCRLWMAERMHGNEFQMGFPDLYCAHFKYGTRWVEIKNPLSYSFTAAQQEIFPKLAAHGVGVWVITAATEFEYQKLFGPPNWFTYLSVFK